LQEETQIQKESRFNWRFWLNYKWIVRNIPFFLYCALLCVLYIANGHYGDKMIRQINRLGREVKELGYENKTLSGALLFQSKQTQLEETVAPLGLSVAAEEPIVITDSLMVKTNATGY
jgi:hypothetical protein